MGKRFEVTPEQVDWLRNAIKQGISRKDMATYLHCDVTTLRRVLVRHDLAIFNGSKYAIAPETLMWTRPCITCKSTISRPKNQYICDNCTKHNELGDEWL